MAPGHCRRSPARLHRQTRKRLRRRLGDNNTEPMFWIKMDKYGVPTPSTLAGTLNQELLNSTITDVEFRYEPLWHLKANLAIMLGMISPRCMLAILGVREIPSRHHRFISFTATMPYAPAPRDTDSSPDEAERTVRLTGTVNIYGTMEHSQNEAVCCLYQTPPVYNQQSNVHVHGDLRGACTGDRTFTVRELFEKAWTGGYKILKNNCIDYAMRCWNLLQPARTVEYKDVCHARMK